VPVLGGPAGAVRSMVAMLNAHLNTAIDAVWSDAGNTMTDGEATIAVTKVYPVRIIAHGRAKVPSQFPVIMVQTMSGSYQPGEETIYNDLGHRLMLTWAFIAESVQLAEELCARYQAAIFWCIEKNKELDGLMPGCYNTMPGDYAMKAPKDMGRIIRLGQMVVTVMALETAPY